MFIKSDSNFSVFVSDLRKLTEKEKTVRIISERRKIYQHDDKTFEISNLLKMIYFIHLNYSYDTMVFIKAIGSESIMTKKIGYLGLLISAEKMYFILTFNTLMKDLKDKKYKDVALNFLCNVNYIDSSYKDLCGLISNRSNSDPFQVKCIIARNKIDTLERISLVGTNETLLFVKIQIILERLLCNQNIDLNENDLLFLTSCYGTVSNTYLKVKLLQLYKILYTKYQVKLTKGFFQLIERELILPHEAIKPLVDISLSIEIVDLFYTTSNQSQKVDNFIFRLIDSQNSNSRYMGFKLAIKYKIFTNQILEKAIKIGLHNSDCLEGVFFCLNKTTYKEIYKRKEEMRFMMAKHNIKESKSNAIMNQIIKKILELAKDDFYLKVCYENPEICINNPINRDFSTELRMSYVKKVLQNNKMKYYCLLYDILPCNCKERDFYNDLFKRHIKVVLSSKSSKKFVILDRLINYYLSLDSLDICRDFLVLQYVEQEEEFKQILLDSINLMNLKCNDNAVLIDTFGFIYYQVDKRLLKIKIKEEIDSLEVHSNGEYLKKYKLYRIENYSIYEYELLESKDLSLNMKFSGNLYKKQIYI